MGIPEHIKEYLEYIVNCIKKTIPVSAIYLFGSYAIGDFNSNSDLDIYIVTPDKTRRLLDLSVEISKSIGIPRRIPIDILVNYEDEFIRRCHLNFTLEKEVINKGIDINGL